MANPLNLGLNTTKGEIFQGSLSSYAVIDSPFFYLPHMVNMQLGDYTGVGASLIVNATSNHPEWWSNVFPSSGGTPVTEHFSKHSSLSYTTYVGSTSIAAKRQWYNPLNPGPWLSNIDDTFDPRITKSDWHARKVEKHWTFALWTNTINTGNVPWDPFLKIPFFNVNVFMHLDSQIGFRLKEGQTVFDTSTWEPAVTSTSNGPFGQNGSFIANWGASAPIQIRAVAHDATLHPADLKDNWLVNNAGTELQFFYESGIASTGLSPLGVGLDEFTDVWNPPPPAANEAPTVIKVLASPVAVSGFKAVGQPSSQDAPTNFKAILPPQEALVFNDPIFNPQEDSKVLNLDTLASPMLGEFPLHFKTRKLILFNDILDQVSSMLGADQWEDLPLIDQERVKIVVNQAYRECYAPIDGRRPRWATEKMTIRFLEGQEYAPLSMDVIDIEKLPELVGHGPLSPMNAGTDQVSIRSHFSGDFRPLPGYKGNYRSMNIDDPEVDQPVWYFIDQSNDGDGYIVVPRLFVYPIPDKEYEVRLVANMLPEGMDLGDSPRLPAEVVWDILLPIAQYKLLTDPRFNGDNRELIMMQAKEAKRKLRSFASPQKHKTVRIKTRRGW